jgi:polyisoprenoid-binding protein YceI
MASSADTATVSHPSALLMVLLIALAPTSILLAQQTGNIPSGRVASGTLSFDGHATVGDFVGRTQEVTGQITGARELGGVRGWVEAPVQSLKTGDGKRDKDLNKSMESAKYPTLRFDLTGISPHPAKGDTVPVTLQGMLHLHGVTQRVQLPGTIQLRDNQARVQTDFPLNLKDYKIGGLSKALGLLKMSEKIEVHVDLTFQLAGAG